MLRKVIREGLNHVSLCELCQARGHICQGCHSQAVLFPFKVSIIRGARRTAGLIMFDLQVGVLECPECYSCYHQACYNPDRGCSRCQRKKDRSSQPDSQH